MVHIFPAVYYKWFWPALPGTGGKNIKDGMAPLNLPHCSWAAMYCRNEACGNNTIAGWLVPTCFPNVNRETNFPIHQSVSMKIIGMNVGQVSSFSPLPRTWISLDLWHNSISKHLRKSKSAAWTLSTAALLGVQLAATAQVSFHFLTGTAFATSRGGLRRTEDWFLLLGNA